VNYRQPLICKLLGGQVGGHPSLVGKIISVACRYHQPVWVGTVGTTNLSTLTPCEPTVGTFKMTSSAARARSASCVAKDFSWTFFLIFQEAPFF